MKIFNRIFYFNAVIGLCAVLIISFIFYFLIRNALMERTIDQLASVNQLKKEQIDNYFTMHEKDLGFLFTHQFFLEHFNGLKGESLTKLNFPGDVGNELKSILDVYEFDDIHVLDTAKKIVFSASGNPLTGIHRLPESANTFMPIDVSEGDTLMQTTLLYMIPLVVQSRSLGTIVVTENFDKVQNLLLENAGMGSTGESYLVGPDGRLRSISRFFPERSPLSIQTKKVDATADHTRIDYRGEKVISVSKPISHKVLHWQLFSEIDYQEALLPVVRFRNYLIILTVVVAASIFVISIIISRFNQLEVKLVNDKALALLEGQEQERKRLTRELHDGVGQMLTAIRLRIELFPVDSIQRKELISLLNETVGEVKRISWDVMPGALVDFGLESALKSLCDNTARYSKLKFDIRFVRETEHDLNFETTVAVFRIVQEGINNILKHAGATNVDLHIIDKPEELYVLLKDDGKGFIDTGTSNGLGLRSIRERAKLLGGSAAIHSAPGEGTEVEVHIPFVANKS